MLSLCEALSVTSQPKLRRSTTPRFICSSLPQLFVEPTFSNSEVVDAPTDAGIGTLMSASCVVLL